MDALQSTQLFEFLINFQDMFIPRVTETENFGATSDYCYHGNMFPVVFIIWAVFQKPLILGSDICCGLVMCNVMVWPWFDLWHCRGDLYLKSFLGYILGTIRCRKLILGRNIGWGCRYATLWCDLDVTFDLAIMTLGFKILSWLYLRDYKV